MQSCLPTLARYPCRDSMFVGAAKNGVRRWGGKGIFEFSPVTTGQPPGFQPHSTPCTGLSTQTLAVYRKPPRRGRIHIPNARHLPIGVRGVLRALSAVAAGKVAICEKVSRGTSGSQKNITRNEAKRVQIPRTGIGHNDPRSI